MKNAEQYFAQPSVMTAQEHFANAPTTDIPPSTADDRDWETN